VIDGKGQRRLLNFGESPEQLKARYPEWKASRKIGYATISQSLQPDARRPSGMEARAIR